MNVWIILIIYDCFNQRQSCWCGDGHKFGDPVDEIDLACHNYFR